MSSKRSKRTVLVFPIPKRRSRLSNKALKNWQQIASLQHRVIDLELLVEQLVHRVNSLSPSYYYHRIPIHPYHPPFYPGTRMHYPAQAIRGATYSPEEIVRRRQARLDTPFVSTELLNAARTSAGLAPIKGKTATATVWDEAPRFPSEATMREAAKALKGKVRRKPSTFFRTGD